jgi:hypothetical protein
MPWTSYGTAQAVRNCRQDGEALRDEGPSPAAARIRRIVPSPIRCPRPTSSPWMRRWPQQELSRASRTTRSRTSAVIGGRPGLAGKVQCRLTKRRCRAKSVP